MRTLGGGGEVRSPGHGQNTDPSMLLAGEFYSSTVAQGPYMHGITITNLELKSKEFVRTIYVKKATVTPPSVDIGE